jgi:glycosyltransferase involved in cell wall biosynthesis
MNSVSIIISVYNAEKYVKRCLESVVSQTHHHQQIVCIIVDDCSIDSSADIVTHFIAINKNCNISFIFHQQAKNEGVSAARNIGIRKASNDYIFFMDSDDYIYPICIESLIQAAIENNDADLVIGNSYNQRSNMYFTDSKDVVAINGSMEIWRTLYQMIYTTFPWNRLIKRRIITENKIYFENVSYEE